MAYYGGVSTTGLRRMAARLEAKHRRKVDDSSLIYYDARPALAEIEGITRVLRNRAAFTKGR